MTKKYKYEVEEYSQDTRSFFVESDIELTHDEINECVTQCISLEQLPRLEQKYKDEVYTQVYWN
jgi:hypothetical protein